MTGIQNFAWHEQNELRTTTLKLTLSQLLFSLFAVPNHHPFLLRLLQETLKFGYTVLPHVEFVLLRVVKGFFQVCTSYHHPLTLKHLYSFQMHFNSMPNLSAQLGQPPPTPKKSELCQNTLPVALCFLWLAQFQCVPFVACLRYFLKKWKIKDAHLLTFLLLVTLYTLVTSYHGGVRSSLLLWRTSWPLTKTNKQTNRSKQKNIWFWSYPIFT